MYREVNAHFGGDGSYFTKNGKRFCYEDGLGPYEYLMGALAGCFTSTLMDILDQEGIACGDIDVHCFGEKRGSIPTTLENTWIEMRIHGSGDIPEERILSCIEKTKETCSIYQTIRQVSAMHVKFEVIRG